jgi:RNA-directed DNA polymerase
MNAIRAKVREAADRRFVGHALAWIVGDLNRVLRGWGAYFRYGNSARKFADIDSYVHERLAIFASIKHGLRYHRNWTHRFSWAWVRGLGVYRLSGRVRSGRCACAAVNDVGKPCAGELHARFDRGPLVDQPG